MIFHMRNSTYVFIPTEASWDTLRCLFTERVVQHWYEDHRRKIQQNDRWSSSGQAYPQGQEAWLGIQGRDNTRASFDIPTFWWLQPSSHWYAFVSRSFWSRSDGEYGSIDPAIGKAGGFGGEFLSYPTFSASTHLRDAGVILHGLSTFGFAARALLKSVGGNQPDALKLFGVRFTSPVKPGDALETQIWEVGPGPDGTIEVTFVTKNLKTGKVCSFELRFSVIIWQGFLGCPRRRYCVYCQISVQ